MLKKLLNKEPFIIASGFFILSFLWIIFSDRILLYLFKDALKLTNFQSFKGWFYVTMATFYIFYLVNREINKKNHLIYLLNKKNEWQNLLISNIPNIEVLLFDSEPEIILMQGKNLFSAIKDTTNEKAFDEILTFRNDKQLISFSELKKDILSGNPVNLNYEDPGYSLQIKGRPVLDDTGEIIAGLLVYINNLEHTTMLKQIEEEKENYAALFNEYHTVNMELKRSYEKLLLKNKELEKSRERYVNFFMQSTDGIYRLDFKKPLDLKVSAEEQKRYILENGFLAECNPVFAEVYGKKDVNELLFNKISELHDIETISIYTQLAEKLVQSNYRIKNVETCEPTLDKEERFYLNTMVGIIESGQLVRIWGTKTNITQLKQYERELILAKKDAEESDKLKSAFLANMSHEIRTPLNGIVGFSELLCQQHIHPQQRKKYLQIVKASNKQLLRIIDDILDISRIDTGQLLIDKYSFHLNKLMEDLEFSLTNEIENSGKPITTSCFLQFSDNEDSIYSDQSRVHQILTNLLNNSIKFTDSGKIEFGYKSIEGNKVEFFVSDTGIGIEEELQKTIFKQFSQAEEYITKSYGGTGLGLAISKGLVELLGGKISVESSPLEGSVFRFTLPINQDNS